MKKQYMPAVIVCVLILLLAAAGVGIHVVKKYIPTKEAHGSERMLRQDCGGRVRDRPGNRDYGGARSNI